MPKGSRAVPIIVIAGAIAGVLWWLDGRGTRTGLETPSHSPASVARKALSPSAVLAIDVTRASPAPGARAQPARASALGVEFDRARTLKPLYDSVTGPHAVESAAAKFVRYEILLTCAAQGEHKGPAVTTWSPERRRKIADSMPDTAPEKQRRLEAFDRMAARCAGLENLATTKEELDALLDAAAQGGDPTARAARMQRDILPDGFTYGQQRIDESQLRALREIAASRDPAAIFAAGSLLSNGYSNVVVQVNGEDIDGPMAYQAWRLVACDYGLECGPESRRLDIACAAFGACNAGNLTDYTYFYEASPNGAQAVDQYRRIFQQAVETGDWSQVQATWRPNPNPLSMNGWFPP